MNCQSRLVSVRDGVHDVNLYLSFHGDVLDVYHLSPCIGLLLARELEVVDGFGGLPRGVVVYPCFFIPFFLHPSYEGKSRLHSSTFTAGYVGTILSMCPICDFLTEIDHSIDPAKAGWVPI